MISFVKEEKKEKLTNRSRRSGESYWCELTNVSKKEIWSILGKYGELRYKRKEEEVLRVIDFKCVPGRIYRPGKLKARKAQKPYLDVRKQITYEYALQLDGVDKTKSKLCIPMYYDDPVDDIGDTVDERELHSQFRDQGIDVLRVDFDQVLEGYLEHENTEIIHA